MESKLLDIGTKFNVRILGVKVKFTIKPQRLCSLLYMKEEAKKIKYDENLKGAISVIGMDADNIKPKSRIIAYAILRSSLKIKLFSAILSRILVEFITPPELELLLMIVFKHSETESLFQSTILAKNIIPAAGVVMSPEENQSPDKSPDS